MANVKTEAKIVFGLDNLLLQPSTNLPARVEMENLAERIKPLSSVLPMSWAKIEEVAIFKKLENPDPILAIRVGGQWFSLFEWE